MTSPQDNKQRVIRSYRSPVVRAYCTARFLIMNMRILEEIGQYLPAKGRILDVGCGFGLFTLFYCMQAEGRNFRSLDLSQKRIEMARESAERLGLAGQARFEASAAEELTGEEASFDAAYMLDLVHHLPRAKQEGVLRTAHGLLKPGGLLIVKDIATCPRWKMWFTWILDMMMSPSQPPHYVEVASMRSRLEEIGFDVKIHSLLDTLPYPHVLYLCRKDATG